MADLGSMNIMGESSNLHTMRISLVHNCRQPLP
jgi:hypothetical protein